MKVSELKAEMDAAFRAVHERFETVNERFETVNERFKTVDHRFSAIDQRFSELEARITAEGERTRRHFDIVAERLETTFSAMLVVPADQTRQLAQNRSEHTTFTGILDDHELRLKALERFRRR